MRPARVLALSGALSFGIAALAGEPAAAGLGLLLILAAGVALAASEFMALQADRRGPAFVDVNTCEECGYDLARLPTDRCPECGMMRRPPHLHRSAG